MASPPSRGDPTSKEAVPLPHYAPPASPKTTLTLKRERSPDAEIEGAPLPEPKDTLSRCVQPHSAADRGKSVQPPTAADRGKMPMPDCMSPPSEKLKRARPSTSLRIGTPGGSANPDDDPDGSPALFREVLYTHPGLTTTILKLAESASLRRKGQSGVFIGGRERSAFHVPAPSGSRSATAPAFPPVAAAPQGRMSPQLREGGRMMPGRYSIGGRMDPVPFQRGRSFVHIFNTPFKTSLEIPVDYWLATPNRSTHSLMLYGDIIYALRVVVEQINGKCYLTQGWSEFVEVERIARNDIAVFVGLESNNVLVRLYAANGRERPWIHRPAPGHADLEDFPINEPPPAMPPPDNVHVPDHLLNMVYEFGPGVIMTAHIMQTVANAWHNGPSSYPLYICKLTPSQVGPKAAFYFCRRFSRFLHPVVAVNLYMGDSMVAHEGILVRHQRNPDIARLVTGWNTFAVWAGLESNVVYVVRIWEYQLGRYSIRFYRTA